MGILYEDSQESTRDLESNNVSCNIPVEQSVPMFILRHRKPRRSQRRSARRSLLPHLSFSGLSDDIEIARLMSSTISYLPSPTIQHRHIPTLSPISTNIDIPQSLPASPALELGQCSLSGSGFLSSDQHLLNKSSNSTRSLALDSTGDWEFITTPQHKPHLPSPPSEAETWILLSDDS